ncbi:MAG: dodecin domain-containing protein [Acidobacteriota bacterium]
MFASHENRHQDVLRAIVSSETSFDDAVRDGIPEIAHDHPELEFKTFEAVAFQGVIRDDNVKVFQVVIDIAGFHKHSHDH